MIDFSMLEGHARPALSISGGKDSLAVAYLLRDHLDKIICYHTDTGDLLPEQRAVVDHVRGFAPNFVTIRTDALAWGSQYGLPSDLVPHTAHWVGREMAESATPLVHRYDCCWANLMEPTYRTIVEHGCTLLIRGTKAVDMKRLPVSTGEAHDGVTIWYPLRDWTNKDVFHYLRTQGAPISRVYDYVENSPECARCTAWWSEQRNAYLKRFYPALWVDYQHRLSQVIAEIEPVIGNLVTEMQPRRDAPDLPIDLLDQISASPLLPKVLQGHRLHPDEREHVLRLMDYMHLPGNAHVLDAGCGTGEMARLIADERPDLTWSLVNRSWEQLKQVPADARLKRYNTDFHTLSQATASQDVVLFCYSLCHGDHYHALREAARVTKPGGSLFVYDYERLRGDNTLMEARLFARAYTHDDIVALAHATGWTLEFVAHPHGNSALFRELFDTHADYTAIFQDLRPAIWRFVRTLS